MNPTIHPAGRHDDESLDLFVEELADAELSAEELPGANAYGTFACFGSAASACGCASSAGSVSSAG